MKAEPHVLSDDWKRNWQQSIAVRISALALWVVLPITLGITFYFIGNLDQDLEKQFLRNADILAFQLQSYFEENSFAQNATLNSTVKRLADELEFSSVKISYGENEWEFGPADANAKIIRREIKVPAGRANEYSTIKVYAYYPKMDELIIKKRNHVLFPVVIGVIIFGGFLIWAIRTMVHRPLENIVDATRAISDGVTDLRLDTSRQDEFGYIARFFNQMLDQLMEQQQQLKYAVTEAKNANDAKSSFLANMSHELRTPLNAIIGYADLLVDQATDLQQLEYVSDLHKIRTAGDYLLDLINNVLDISKIEAGKMEIYYENVNVETMIGDIATTMIPQVEKNKNELVVEVEGNLGQIITDYTKLRQIIFNLMSNACKFTEHGRIALRVYRYTYKTKEQIIIEVEDTGTGMSRECLCGLFEPFVRGRNSTTLKISGTGLGLAISRHFCNLMGGEISVDSTVGIGTVFKIHLPYRKAKEEADSLRAASACSK